MGPPEVGWPGMKGYSHVYRHTLTHYVDGDGRCGIESSFASFNLLGDLRPPRIILQVLIVRETFLQYIANRVID